MSGPAVRVTVGGHELSLTNLEKVLYPSIGFTKREVLRYYAMVAPALLPHVFGRALTLKRYPDGVEGKFFFEKNVPKSAPSWVHRVKVPSAASRRGTGVVEYPVICDVATLTWIANLASLELHVPLWRAGRGESPRPPDLMVFDLDPGPGTTIVECCAVAQRLAPLLEYEGLQVYPKTSGSKGLQLYVPVRSWSWEKMSGFAHDLAREVEAQDPSKVVSKMTKSLREGKVLIDWSQNSPSKTTVAAYSLRACARPTVSTPIEWSDVDACVDKGEPDLLVFEANEVIERVEHYGDLFAPLLPASQDTRARSAS